MKEFFSNEFATLYNCDSRQMPIADESVDCVVTSPPYYGLRDYGIDGQMGLEESPEEYAFHSRMREANAEILLNGHRPFRLFILTHL